ncbi:serine/threonine-protein phosphatase 2A regulatory subunit B'' subunit gamma-like isoform X1 [Lucilia sericata]|uniref:serine/threonine-protein phosphatase 2A regulatory subunit B'' subunit gamma-like isoform X1 n=1 Tax=Lucilia sericata TaxID=13632 RepID=UPI0018A82DFA|nr:serine/threonine-protein phosphatase 2A regulatory subunit B'' subunit gamma-like isoform X1 [Lucilia sericata]
MELDPDIVKEFEQLEVSSQKPSEEDLDKFNENEPLKAVSSCGKNKLPLANHHTYTTIPKFFHAPPAANDTLRQNLRKEAHSLFLQKRSQELLDNEELNTLWSILEKHCTQVTPLGQQLIGYDDYLKVMQAVSVKCRKYLTARLFAKLQCHSGYPGKVEIVSIFNYTMRKVWLTQGRIGLSFYDDVGQGYLREIDMENYIIDIIPTLAQISSCVQPSFQSFYVCTVVKKFFFFLDPLHTGRIRIRDILASGLLTELLELRDEDSSKESQEHNWFSMPSVLTVYGNYLNLDKDHNGMLSKQELADYGSGTLTSVFLDRVFDECRTFDGEMDYKTFLDFVLALDNRHEPQSLHYLFRILDVQHKGYLTAQTLHYFFKGIQEQIRAVNAESVNFEDLKDEIFDMVKSKDPYKITLQDLINCGQAETVVSILIEFHKFWAYENREEGECLHEEKET